MAASAEGTARLCAGSSCLPQDHNASQCAGPYESLARRVHDLTSSGGRRRSCCVPEATPDPSAAAERIEERGKRGISPAYIATLALTCARSRAGASRQELSHAFRHRRSGRLGAEATSACRRPLGEVRLPCRRPSFHGPTGCRASRRGPVGTDYRYGRS